MNAILRRPASHIVARQDEHRDILGWIGSGA